MHMAGRIYRFGPFRVFTATRELHEGGAAVEVPARAFDCLVYLIEHRERAVGRDELIAAVWGRADVSEALLNHTILRIRRALGSGGSELIRTVPRFGYRWAGGVDEEEHAASEAIEAPAPAPIEPAVAPASRNPSWLTRSRVLVAGAVGVAIVIAALALTHRPSRVAPDVAPATAPPSEETVALPALVLPADVDASEDWAWLRFGIMDLVANRLRSGSIKTAPSESVVAMLKQRGSANGVALLDDPSLAQVAALRVLPRVRFDGGQWIVQLDAAGMQNAIAVEAEAADPIGAAREAANRLLARLGHAAAATADADSTPALDDLLQRSGAAMLADQLDAARKMIEAAPAALRDAPRLQQRMAQIELRAGEYDAVEKRLVALIDRLDAKRDAALRARALITLASSYVRRNQFEKADEAYSEALALRADAKDPEALGIAYLGHGVVLAERGRFDEANAELGRARIELESAGDPLGVAQVDVNLGDFQVMRHRPADALPILRNAADRFEKLGAREGRVYALVQVAAVERELLDPAASLATTERFWPPEANTSNPRMQWNAVRSRIEALAANGRLRDAETLVRRVRSEADPRRDAALRAQVEAIAARIAAARGDAPEAARLAEASATALLLDSDKALYAKTLRLGARSARKAGDATAAAAMGARLRELAKTANDDEIVLEAALADAAEAAAAERRDAALQAYAAAFERAGKLNVPDDVVAAGAPYVEALIDASHLDDARAIAGRLAPWAERDLRAAWAQVRLYRALDRPDAERSALTAATRLAGDGVLPEPAETPPDDAAAAR
jgi:DNA-binding winged helix-turn-helix (wHTH) protein/tetratricopeptide (TPR) repeat protein